MRKFRFVGNPLDYSTKDKLPKLFGENPVFNEDEKPTDWGATIGEIANEYSGEWIEVTAQKPLHKDTDLGYFAGLMLCNGHTVEYSILRAKELINQLDNEAGRN